MSKEATENDDPGFDPFVGGTNFDHEFEISDEDRALMDANLENVQDADEAAEEDAVVNATTDADEEGAGDDEEAPADEAESDEAEGDDAAGETEGEVIPDSKQETDESQSDDESNGEGDSATADTPMIPKWRFDQKVKQLRTAQEQLASNRAPAADAEAPAPLDMATIKANADPDLVAKHADAVMDGKTDEAASLMNQILDGALQSGMSALIPSITAEVTRNVTAGVVSTVDKDSSDRAFDSAVAEVNEAYDFTDPKSDNYDKAFMDDALIFMAGHQANGETAAAAVYLATEQAIKIHKPEMLKPADANADAAQAAKDLVAQRKQEKATEARAKNAKAAKQQPADTNDESQSSRSEAQSNVVDVDTLSDDEFDALPESTKAQLRGDFG